jgi:hypothetical protein
MWRLLSVLTLCGMPALCADVCGGLPTGDPKALSFWRAADKLPPPASFQLSVKRGGPAFRITVRPLAFDLKGNGIAVHAGEIEVARCQDGKQLQVLPILAWQPIDFGASFHADDINFDGYLDFSVLTEIASKFGSRSYWVYDPSSRLFVENELTRKLGENCLGSEWHGGCWKAIQIAFDQNTREIRADYPIAHIGEHQGLTGSPSVLSPHESYQPIVAIKVDPLSRWCVDQLAFHNQRERGTASRQVDGQIGTLFQVTPIVTNRLFSPHDVSDQLRPENVFFKQSVKAGFHQGIYFSFSTRKKC